MWFENGARTACAMFRKRLTQNRRHPLEEIVAEKIGRKYAIGLRNCE